MESAIQNYSFESSNVRIFVESGEPWFCAADVCKSLGYANTPDALKKHCSEDGIAKRDTIDSLGRNQSSSFIDERNLYRLVMRSKLPSAEKFQDWVCGEVLPSIRKTGKYSVAQPQLPQDYKEALRQLLCEVEQREALQEKNLLLENKAKEDAPKVEFADGVIATGKEMCIRDASKVWGAKPKICFDWLRLNNFIYKQTNQATQKAIDMGLMVVRFAQIPRADCVEQKPYAHVTGKGLVYFYKKLRDAGIVARNPTLEMAV